MSQEPQAANPTARVGLTIVIPALNEEGAIASTIERCLAARAGLARAGVAEAVVVVVSDGSTDRTAQIARQYPAVHLMEFEQNQGYGAAIQAGWQARPNALLGFIDADGTCDPENFAPMCKLVLDEGADMVLGSRMNVGTRMPLVRRLGNLGYAILLRLLSQHRVRDTASGMRILRRSALPRLLPLPSGLHFTPAISARALLEGMKVVEMPMSYEERVGRSKLRVFRDGLRFLGIILATTLYVRPSRLLLPTTGALLACSAWMMVLPATEYARGEPLEDWLIYRFLLAALLVVVSGLLLGSTMLLEQLVAVSRGAHRDRSAGRGAWWTRVSDRHLVALLGALALVAAALAWPAARSYVSTRTVTTHWSRIVLAMLCGMLAAQVGVTVFLNRVVLGVARQQREWLRSQER